MDNNVSSISVEKIAKHILDTIETYPGSYFSAGSQVLISVDSPRDINSFQNLDLANAYYDFFIAGNSPKDPEFDVNNPHIYKLINNAYNHMLFSNQDQTVIFMGHTASGKSLNKLDSIFMLKVMNPTNSQFFDKVFSSIKVTDYFTCSRIDKSNLHSSRTNSILDILFDNYGSPIGAKTTLLSIDSGRFKANSRLSSNKSPFLPSLNKLGNLSSPSSTSSDIDFPTFQIVDLFKEIHSYRTLSLGLDTDFGLGHDSDFPDFNDVSSIGNQELIDLQALFKTVGISNKLTAKIFSMLYSIVCLYSLDFVNDPSSNSVRPASIPNGLVSSLGFIGSADQLSDLLTTSRSNINGNRVVTMLSIAAAINKKQDLCWILYRQLVYWIVETTNNNMSTQEDSLAFSFLDTMGTNNTASDFDLLSINFFNDRLINFLSFEVFQSDNVHYTKENIDVVPIIKTNSDNKSRLNLYLNPDYGIFSIIESNSDSIISSAFISPKNSSASNYSLAISNSTFYSSNFAEDDSKVFMDLKKVLDSDSSHFLGFGRKSNSFEISHFFGKTDYSVTNLCRDNVVESKPFFEDEYSKLLTQGNSKSFISALFSNADSENSSSMYVTVKKLAQNANDVISQIESSKTWFVVCLLTNISNSSISFSNKYLTSQLQSYNMDLIVRRKRVEFFISFTFPQFIELFHHKSNDEGVIQNIKKHLKYDNSDFFIGKTQVFLSSDCFNNMVYLFNNNLLDLDKIDNNDEESASENVAEEAVRGGAMDVESRGGSSEASSSQSKNRFATEKVIQMPQKHTVKKSGQRKFWLFIVYSLTFYIPTFVVSICTGIKDKQRLMAWREKVALCTIILLSCLFVIFWIGIVGILICPKQNVYSIPELNGHTSDREPLIAIRGEVFNMNNFQHNGITYKFLKDNNYMGRDLSSKFPFQLSYVCAGLDVDPRLSMQDKPILYSDTYYHDHRWYRHSNENSGFNYYQYNIMRVLRTGRSHGRIAFDPKQLLTLSVTNPNDNVYRSIINGKVFDLSSYINAGGAPFIVTPDGISNDTNTISAQARNFMSSTVRIMFQQNAGKDISDIWNRYSSSDPVEANINYNCLRGAFYIGDVDYRKSFKCYFANYMLLAGSIFIVSMILVKFIASIRIGNKKINPELFESFVICNVPCYTEGEESLKGTIDSIARMTYDDKRKLICIVCDGIVMGSGNDKPTPNILFDILNISNVDSEPLSYFALGENQKQHNMAQIYSGLYEVSGHTVPYLLIVKCGTPSETIKRGNRGKRDSQILLMRFFNKVFFDLPMTPLELELFHQMKNVIGVEPSMYEYILMIDADTISSRMGLSYLLSSMQNDSKIMGACGETQISNPKESWTSMLQVYEYFIAHFMAKSFESLFGTVTCLPGCFCLYRLKSNNGQVPLLISNYVVSEYSTNKAVTLHEKNLLLLGEDRYLTTLMLKNFPNYKTKFVGYANCKTNVPQNWRILLSQRRRWINSTVHNLFELLLLQNMCGFCCFSMRFVVFIDLISTIIMPATMAYLGILVYQLTNTATSFISLYLLIAIYALQALVFILHKQWQHIGWMIIYLLAIPLFSFMIPVYSFWHFDDFSWGNTRKITTEGGGGTDPKNGKFESIEMKAFDPTTIPMRKWSEYEKDLFFDMNSDGVNSRSQTSQSINTRSGAQSRAVTAMSYNPMGMQGIPVSQPMMGFSGNMAPQYGAGFPAPPAPVSVSNGGVQMMNAEMQGFGGNLDPNRASSYFMGRQMVNMNTSANQMNLPQMRNILPTGNDSNFGMYQQPVAVSGSQPIVTNFVNDENAFVANLSAYMQNSQSVVSGNSNVPLLSSNQQNMQPRGQAVLPQLNPFRPQQMNEQAPIPQDSYGEDGSNWPSGISDRLMTEMTFDILSASDLRELSKRDVRALIAQRANMSPDELKLRKGTINNAIVDFINSQNGL
ncbi:Chitin synthase 8 [Smittium mucronatum]|uniref:chitin synthase n=1 Tax=Smittium mucronatum TaxID=133383 RepID=A0A1R0GUL3_9FUNG|nr:Chitin synthase 8 [Smittium mucronatum]